MRGKVFIFVFVLGFLAISIIISESLIENEALTQDILDVYPMLPGEIPTVIWAPEYEDDFYPTSEMQGISAGTGPLVGKNLIKIYIMNTADAGSNCQFIYMDFGPDKHLRLYGNVSGQSFPKGGTLSWDLSTPDRRYFMEGVKQESWDYINLRTTSKDGIRVERIELYHSSEKILDWKVKNWFSSPDHSHLGLAAMILKKKLQRVKNTTNATVHYASRELGKTDGYKYGSGSAWASEFVSWCLRKDGWDTATGSVGPSHLRIFFSALNRLYTKNQIIQGTYIPATGDYLSLFNEGTSVIFVKWIDDISSGIKNNTKFQSIEGNTGKAVRIRTRRVSDIDYVGSAQ